MKSAEIIKALRATLKTWTGLETYLTYISNDKVKPPYIVFTFSEIAFANSQLVYFDFWSKDSSYDSILAIVDKLDPIFATGNQIVDFNGGKLLMAKGSPFKNIMPDMDDKIKRVRVLFEIKYY